MLLDPTLGEDTRTALLSELSDEITATGARIVQQDIWGERTLAYRIRGSITGYYILYSLEAEDGVSFFELTKTFNIKKPIWRFMITRQDD